MCLTHDCLAGVVIVFVSYRMTYLHFVQSLNKLILLEIMHHPITRSWHPMGYTVTVRTSGAETVPAMRGVDVDVRGSRRRGSVASLGRWLEHRLGARCYAMECR